MLKIPKRSDTFRVLDEVRGNRALCGMRTGIYQRTGQCLVYADLEVDAEIGTCSKLLNMFDPCALDAASEITCESSINITA